ncbi:MAG TPA: N-acetylmuramic acid 6-phosphate etherase [Bacillota bacterium]
MFDSLTTEQRNEQTRNIDLLPIYDVLKMMNEEDRNVLQAVESELITIEKAVKLVIHSFKENGRLIYVGAGTSGRLGILDAVECEPTFSSPPEMVQGLMAGGMKAFTKAVEGAEDDAKKGALDLQAIKLCEKDTVIGISASGRTPYVIGALTYANDRKAKTVSIACNKKSRMSALSQVAIELDTGPEIVAGSTRLKAGTAQKIVLNMISTVSMIGIGKVYENLMVDVKPTNEKLAERSKRMIMEATGVDEEIAEQYFERSNRHVKAAIVMILLQCSLEEAEEQLNRNNGFVRNVIQRKEEDYNVD